MPVRFPKFGIRTARAPQRPKLSAEPPRGEVSVEAPADVHILVAEWRGESTVQTLIRDANQTIYRRRHFVCAEIITDLEKGALQRPTRSRCNPERRAIAGPRRSHADIQPATVIDRQIEFADPKLIADKPACHWLVYHCIVRRTATVGRTHRQCLHL